MATSNTLTNSGSLVDLWSVFKLSHPFPGIFSAVSEENVSGSNFIASVVVLSTFDSGEFSHIEFREHYLAVLDPVVIVDVF